MSVCQAWVFTCSRCGHESGGYPDEVTAERAEDTHGLFEHSKPHESGRQLTRGDSSLPAAKDGDNR